MSCYSRSSCSKISLYATLVERNCKGLACAPKETGAGYVVAHKVAMKNRNAKPEKPGPKVLAPMFKK